MAKRTHSPTPSSVLRLLLVVGLFSLFYLCQVSLCQDGNLQREYLRLLGRTSNSELVLSCTTITSIILNCSLNSTEFVTDPMDSTNSSFVRVELRICLCDSAWEIIYFYTDGTNVATPCTQCPFQLLEGELSLYHNISVFEMDRNGTKETNTGISVVLNAGDSSRTVFNGTIPLSEQADNCGNNSRGPPDPRDCASHTTQPPIEPTTDLTSSPPVTTTSSPPGGISAGIIAAIVVVVGGVAVIVVLIALILCLALWCSGRRQSKPNQHIGPQEDTYLKLNSTPDPKIN